MFVFIVSSACFHEGQPLQPGDSISDNCNSCECSPEGVVSCTNFKCLSDPSLLQQLGAGTGSLYPNRWGWTATNYTSFWGRKLEDGVLHRTGTEDSENTLYPIFLEYDLSSIPREFDARAVWKRRISRVRDQGWCGSSWAFSTITVATDRYFSTITVATDRYFSTITVATDRYFSTITVATDRYFSTITVATDRYFSTITIATDRLAIESEGIEAIPLSPQNLISCDRRVQQGCEGGKIERAWQYLRRYGVVGEDCYPYTSGTTLTKQQCRVNRRLDFTSVPCDTSEQLSVGRKSLYKMEPAYRIRSRESDIQYEIMSNGPVQAKMRVEQDFFTYRSGVYVSSGLSDQYVIGHHSVRLIGWGEEYSTYDSQPVKFWLAANSWGEDWGERGLFRIRRGVNESGIEENILAVRAALLTHYPPDATVDNNSQWFYD
ncbi:Peptidase C1A papain C-terminal [Trinorchestia longiramus]|nr:Peptidase C1A papain C-terminal [Trinorchestia longiramus]